MSYDGQIPGISVCVSAACPAGAAGGGIPISIFLPFPRSPEGFLPGYLFIAPAGRRPPAAGSKTQPWGKGRAVNSRLFFPPPRLACVFPNPKRAGRKAPSFWFWRDLGVREMGLSKESCGLEFGMMAQVWLLGCSAAPAQPQCSPPSRSQLREDSPSPVTTCGNPDAEELCW